MKTKLSRNNWPLRALVSFFLSVLFIYSFTYPTAFADIGLDAEQKMALQQANRSSEHLIAHAFSIEKESPYHGIINQGNSHYELTILEKSGKEQFQVATYNDLIPASNYQLLAFDYVPEGDESPYPYFILTFSPKDSSSEWLFFSFNVGLCPDDEWRVFLYNCRTKTNHQYLLMMQTDTDHLGHTYLRPDLDWTVEYRELNDNLDVISSTFLNPLSSDTLPFSSLLHEFDSVNVLSFISSEVEH